MSDIKLKVVIIKNSRIWSSNTDISQSTAKSKIHHSPNLGNKTPKPVLFPVDVIFNKFASKFVDVGQKNDYKIQMCNKRQTSLSRDMRDA